MEKQILVKWKQRSSQDLTINSREISEMVGDYPHPIEDYTFAIQRQL